MTAEYFAKNPPGPISRDGAGKDTPADDNTDSGFDPRATRQNQLDDLAS